LAIETSVVIEFFKKTRIKNKKKKRKAERVLKPYAYFQKNQQKKN